MSLFHAYSQTVADGTATSVVRPSDWNSAHIQGMSLSGNVGTLTTVSGSDIVFMGGNNVTLSGSQGAGAATVLIHGPAGGAGATESFYQPEMYGGTVTQANANGSMLFRPFELEGPADMDRFLFQASVSMRQTTMSLSGSVSGASTGTGNGSYGMTGTIAMFSRVQTVEGAASSASIASMWSATTTMSNGLTFSLSQSTNAGSATVSYSTTQAIGFIKNIGTDGGVTYSTVSSTGSASFSSNSTAAATFSSTATIGAFANSQLSGVRPWNAPGRPAVFDPGEYYLGVQISSTGGSTSIASLDRVCSMTSHGFLHFTASTNNYLEIGNSANLSTSNWRPGFGSYSGTASTTGNVALSQITTNASNASLYFAGIGHAL